MGRALARNVLHALIAQGMRVDAAQQMLSGTEQHRADGKMQLIYQAGAQILAYRRYAAA